MDLSSITNLSNINISQEGIWLFIGIIAVVIIWLAYIVVFLNYREKLKEIERN